MGEQLFFMCFKDDAKQPLMNRLMLLSPEFCFARVNLRTDKVEYFEVPVHVDDRVKSWWKEELRTTAPNPRGLDTAGDKRSNRDGWYWCFNGNPIRVNDTLFFTTMIGNCYTFRVVDGAFDENAFIAVNPLGIRSESWSLNTLTFANEKRYHCTAKELIRVGSP